MELLVIVEFQIYHFIKDILHKRIRNTLSDLESAFSASGSAFLTFSSTATLGSLGPEETNR